MRRSGPTMTSILLAYSWGHRYPQPGLSNEFMAGELTRLKGRYDFCLAQIEIAEAMKDFEPPPDHIVGKMGEYLNTYEVTSLMLAWLKLRNIDLENTDIAVVCHATHWRGCQLVLRKFGVTACRLSMNVPYDPDSAHWYTRTPWQAFCGKIVHGVAYLLRGQLGI